MVNTEGLLEKWTQKSEK